MPILPPCNIPAAQCNGVVGSLESHPAGTHPFRFEEFTRAGSGCGSPAATLATFPPGTIWTAPSSSCGSSRMARRER
jgi:hypothetical protein